MASMDPFSALRSIPPSDPSNMVTYEACACGKLLNAADLLRRWFSGVVNYSEKSCPDCRVKYADAAKIVCIRCKTMQGFFAPGAHPTGFEIQPRAHYHIDGCPRCEAGKVRTPVLEIVRFCQSKNIPVRPDEDIVQESEQKRLQGEREADRLRAHYELLEASDSNKDPH